jgi:poly(A) polymerase
MAVAAMAQSGVLGAALPGADARSFPIAVHFGVNDWLARLVVLGGMPESLRLSRSALAQVSLIREELGQLRSPQELGYRHGAKVAKAIILCRAALFETQPPQGWMHDVEVGAKAVFPVAAADLMPDLQGKALGDRLRALEQIWIDSDFAPTKADLLG